MNKHTLFIKDGIQILKRNGNALMCPFQTKTPVPGQIAGSLQMIQLECSSMCPLFDLNRSIEDETKYCVSLHCSNSDITIHDVEPETPDKPNDSKLIQL